MHDFPINRCLRSFEHVCEDWRGEDGEGGVESQGLWKRVAWWAGPDYPTKGELYIFYSSSSVIERPQPMIPLWRPRPQNTLPPFRTLL